MEAAQKFSSFDELKKGEETATQPLCSDDVKEFLELMRQGEIPVESRHVKSTK
ncbi:hypothetical protein ACLI09_07390 [Flavobacterium sp. RHBU_24]|uniref:hypothetical protein n=1 Tax=Flavobacterium sp. RHBU_24 TaxID=3391185 RepID=UPI003984814E